MSATKMLLAFSLLAASHTYAASYSEPKGDDFQISIASKSASFLPTNIDALTNKPKSGPVSKPDINQALNDTAAGIDKPITFNVNDRPLPGCGCGVPPPVPVPAAAWLMGSGLVGLACITRRRKSRIG